MSRLANCMLMALVLAGCDQAWHLNGKSEAAFKADRDACLRQSEGPMVKVGDMAMPAQKDQAYRQCMEAKGYTAR